MARCAVIDLKTNTQVNFIIAEVTDIPPAGCKLVEIPDGFNWDKATWKIITEVDNSGN
jgi:hypothetical protein